MDDYLDYYHVVRDKKCKLFALTLTEYVQALLKFLPQRSMESWYEFCKNLITHFIHMKMQSTTMVVLCGVTQGNKETLHAYIDRFTKVVKALVG